MSSKLLLEHDIGTDAEVETPQDGPRHHNSPDRLLQSVSENNYGVASLPSAGRCSKKEYIDYVHLMPKHLQNDYIDILIMCAEADEEDAEDFKRFLETHTFTVDILVIGPIITQEAHSLYERSMFYFVYVTKEYQQCSKSKFFTDSFLAKSLSDKVKEGNVFPVLTSDKNECKPGGIFLGNMRTIQYYKKNKDIKNINTILKNKAREIAERKNVLENSRRDYYDKNKSELKSLQAVSNPNFLSMKVPNLTDLKLDDTGRNDNDHSKLENVEVKSEAVSIAHSFGPLEYQPKPEVGTSFSGDIQVDGIPSHNKDVERKLKSLLKSEGSSNNC